MSTIFLALWHFEKIHEDLLGIVMTYLAIHNLEQCALTVHLLLVLFDSSHEVPFGQ